ncbi:MAG: phosphotransferase [Pirellulales bacterium]|nr:phosphotransferase [Pirellulales bacterium]
MNKREMQAAYPDFPWLAADDESTVERVLRERSWLARDERVVGLRPAGEGNMNLTLRVETDRRTLIVKQARPWVEKYDHLAAPWERAEIEARFYLRVAGMAGVASRMPRLLGAQAGIRTLLLEDLGPAADFTSLYSGGTIRAAEIDELAAYAAALHTATRGVDLAGFENRAMRALNHQHIYELPLDSQNGLELDRFEPGLARCAEFLRADDDYREAVAETAARYLADGDTLLHGDYFPGSWLRADDSLRVIDPEFCFAGDPEFDLGVALAHFALAGVPVEAASQLLAAYMGLADRVLIDAEWIARYAACEVMRRLIGVAQLPLPPSTGRRAELLLRSRTAILEGRWSMLWP